MISVVLLSVFSVAATAAIAGGTATSADNRARVGAAGLAQRELDYAAQAIISSPDGARELISQGETENPNVPPELRVASTGGPDPKFAIQMDGQRYRVVRVAAPYGSGGQPQCGGADSAPGTAQGTLVTVTVTWEGMSAAARPHVASKVFPPQPNAAVGLDAGQAQLVVSVNGRDAAGAGPRQGIRVFLSGPGVLTPTLTTNAFGCAVFIVKPDPAGSQYTAKLLGYGGTGTFLSADGQIEPVSPAITIEPGDSLAHAFLGYSLAARLYLTVANAPASVQVVQLRPLFEGGVTQTEQLHGAAADFRDIVPGSYSVDIGGTSRGTVDLAPGAVLSQTVVL
ncbi:MAG: hypothetical protein LBJ02_05235 [Bifidobacteriaceae bacterium]|jgi:hypothetical protein|nr:hypothetical protein [Bifidobacteriaceae bacterium]